MATALSPGFTRFTGRDAGVAYALLKGAELAGMDPLVVRLVDGGFVVPTEVAEAIDFNINDSDQE